VPPRIVGGAANDGEVRCVVVPEEENGSGWLRPVDEDGTPTGPVERAEDLAAAITADERDRNTRWVLPAAETTYPRLLAADVVLARCVDLALTEGLLMGYDGRWGESRGLGRSRPRRARVARTPYGKFRDL